MDNGRTEWYELDLPQVIELRRKLIGDEGARQHFIACSVLDNGWLDTVSAHALRPFLFLAEGVFMYLEAAQVESLVLRLRGRFPGTELVFDAFSPFLVWVGNLRVSRTHIGARSHWALKRSRDLECWGDGIRLLDERFPFASPEPRLAHTPRIARAPWVLRIALFVKAWGLFHHRLGKTAG